MKQHKSVIFGLLALVLWAGQVQAQVTAGDLIGVGVVPAQASAIAKIGNGASITLTASTGDATLAATVGDAYIDAGDDIELDAGDDISLQFGARTWTLDSGLNTLIPNTAGGAAIGTATLPFGNISIEDGSAFQMYDAGSLRSFLYYNSAIGTVLDTDTSIYLNTNNNNTLRLTNNVTSAGNDGVMQLDKVCVTDDTDSGAGTQVLTGVIPAGATSLQVYCYVDSVISGAGASTFSLGDGTDADLYGAGIAFAAGTTITEVDYTASPLTQAWSSSAGNLTLTANAGQFDAGTITCCSTSVSSKPPTT